MTCYLNYSKRFESRDFDDDKTAGPISSESVTFPGGQNPEPSIGGGFVLEDPASKPRYRLRLLPTLLR